jgi:hypothetical protein
MAPGDRPWGLRYLTGMPVGKLRAVASGPAAEASPDAGSLLARLKLGELGLDEYLESRISEAIAPFQDKLPADRIEWMREMLREQLVEDPVLRELTRRATGREPQAG